MNRLFGLVAVATFASTMSACYMEVHDDDHDAQDGTTIRHPEDMPYGLKGYAQTCDESHAADGSLQLQCYKSEDTQWRTSCGGAGCEEVKVYAHYMLADDLGADRVVHVEAFDNEHFSGTPASTVALGRFPARTGEWRETSLFLAPGTYYVRAYLGTGEDETPTPYAFGDMTLVKDQPVGVYGALSTAAAVRVEKGGYGVGSKPVDVYLDKLFKKPGSDPDTQAHLRALLQAPDGFSVPDGRDVRIELRHTEDLAENPVYAFTLPTANLLVTGRMGQADFVSPSLKPDDYLVFAYLDLDADGRWDKAEPNVLYMENRLPKAVRIRADATVSIDMPLALPAAPTPTPTPN
jgi:hypothetical protein